MHNQWQLLQVIAGKNRFIHDLAPLLEPPLPRPGPACLPASEVLVGGATSAAAPAASLGNGGGGGAGPAGVGSREPTRALAA